MAEKERAVRLIVQNNTEGMRRAGILGAIIAGGFLLGAPLAAMAQEPAPPKGAVIEGVVFNAVTGEPLQQAEVGLLLSGAPPGGPVRITASPAQGVPQAGREAQGPLATVTGAGGAFRFENVPDGTYAVQLQRRGMFLWRGRPGLSPMQIEIKGGAPVRGLRYALAPGAVISGTVVDEKGEPVEGAQLALLKRAWEGGRFRWTPAALLASTDDRGEFRLHGIRPGKYLLLVKPPSVASMPGLAVRTVYAPAYYPEASSPSQAQPMAVTAGQQIAGLTIRLRVVPARSISAAVLYPDGSLAQGAFVSAVPVDRDWIPAGEGRTLPGEAPGRYVIDGLAPGRYRLVARLTSRPGRVQPVPAEIVRIASREVDVTQGDAEGIEIRFEPPGVIRGKVVVEGPGSEAMKSELAGLRVLVRNAEWVSAPAAVAEDGTFQVETGAADRHELSVNGSALYRLYIAAIRTGSGADASEGIELRGGGVEQVTIVLRTDGARLTATRAPSGKPEEACTPYFAALHDPDHRGLRPPLLMREAEIGRPAVFFPLAPGEYVIGGFCTAEPAGALDPAFLDRLNQEGTRIRLKPGEQAEVVLKDIPLEGP